MRIICGHNRHDPTLVLRKVDFAFLTIPGSSNIYFTLISGALGTIVASTCQIDLITAFKDKFLLFWGSEKAIILDCFFYSIRYFFVVVFVETR